MITTIKILKSRRLITNRRCIGVVGEKNAEVLDFEFPSDINGEPISSFTPELVFSHKEESFVYQLSGKRFIIPEELTAYNRIAMLIRFKLGDEVKWSSFPTDFYFKEHGADSGVNSSTAVLAEKLSELRKSLTDNVRGDFSDDSWEDIIGTLTEIPPTEIIIGGEQPEPEYRYENGKLDELREALYQLWVSVAAALHSPDEPEPYTCYESIQATVTHNDTLRRILITQLRSAFEINLPYSLTWSEVISKLNALPQDVSNIRTNSAASATAAAESQIEAKVSELYELYDMEEAAVVGSITACLNAIAMLCSTLNNRAEAATVPIINSLYSILIGDDDNDNS